ncbi:hypothetical protein D3C73_979780 [compost metagenome]
MLQINSNRRRLFTGRAGRTLNDCDGERQRLMKPYRLRCFKRWDHCLSLRMITLTQIMGRLPFGCSC